MKVIYEPRGKAAEYSPLAANLYTGCGHGCRYCYAPSCLRMSREAFTQVRERDEVLAHLGREIEKMHGDTRPILLCFTCDPYQPLEEETELTRRAICMLGGAGLHVRVLTKNGPLAVGRDLELFKTYDVEFGSTLLFTDEKDRETWEPGAPPLAERMQAIRTAHAAGVQTWLSIEPVIDPAQALDLVTMLSDCVDVFKVGKMNHNKQIEESVDWPAFLLDVLERLEDTNADYYIKHDLLAFANEDVHTERRE